MSDRLASHLPAILKTLVKAAKSGDLQAAKLILERTLPALKSAGELLTLPASETLAGQGKVVLEAVASGEITPDEAATLMQSISAQARVVEVEELTQRVQALEQVLIRTEVKSMARLTARILKLERRLPIGVEAELAAMSDEELERRSDECLREMSEEDVRLLAREHPDFFTPVVLEMELARWRELHAGTSARGARPLNPAH